ncbi:MAG: hypothetical protein IPN57_09140 [Ignavibacteria bacterium]|nr:hypothetical protein [Ignavibacteria bacterium]
MKNFTASILLFISFLTVTNSYSQWTQSSSGINGGNVKCMAAGGSSVYAGTNLYGVYKSTDNGVTWFQTSLNNRTVYSLVVSGSNIYAGTSLYGLYISSNNGDSWIQTSLILR